MLSVIIPANNEQDYLGPCLEALLAQSLSARAAGGVEVVVAANGCTDDTVQIAQSYVPAFAGRGWDLLVLDIAEGGKLNALNRADAVARGGIRAYLDADVICSPDLLTQLHDVLDGDRALYASGRLRVAPAKSWVTRRYARVWVRLPFVRTNVPGAGIFAVNAAGRARWGDFPDIISDDTFVRVQFTPEERIRVEADYSWPLTEGFANLVRVRRRQDKGVQELAETCPEMMQNEGAPPLRPADYLKLFLGQPVSFVVYAAVLLSVRYGGGQAGWTRGR